MKRFITSGWLFPRKELTAQQFLMAGSGVASVEQFCLKKAYKASCAPRSPNEIWGLRLEIIGGIFETSKKVDVGDKR